MPARIILEVTAGTMKGHSFGFEEHDTFIFGRGPNCHCRLDGDDSVSRHHFLVETNPPDAQVQDLGSTNGTYVNGVKVGGRSRSGSKGRLPVVDLKNGDSIRVGETHLRVRLEHPWECAECGAALSSSSEDISGNESLRLCTRCQERRMSKGMATDPITLLVCRECGKDVRAEVGGARWGDYVCAECRKRQASDPVDMLMELVKEGRAEEDFPEVAGYAIQGRIGKGGYGAVYLAKRRTNNFPAAIKVMLSRVAVNDASRRRFLQEIGVLRRLKHPNVVQLLENGAAGSLFYFIMEYCEGGSVLGLMKRRRGKVPLREAGPLFLQSLSGLEYVHKKGLVHRDVKPSNLLLKRQGKHWEAKVGDMGLAKNFEAVGLSGMTITGTYGGTPYFMPREQITDFKRMKPSSDVWSMGATLYYVLTGTFPREFGPKKNPFEVVLAGKTVPLRERDSSVPKSVAVVADKALSIEPLHRYKDAGEMRLALARAL